MEVKRIQRVQRFEVQQQSSTRAHPEVGIFQSFIRVKLRKLVEDFLTALDATELPKSVDKCVIDLLIGVSLQSVGIISVPPHNETRTT